MVEPKLLFNVQTNSDTFHNHTVSNGLQNGVTVSLQSSSSILSEVLEDDDPEVEDFQGYCAPKWKAWLYYLLGACTCGLLFLFCSWSVQLRLWFTLKKCALPEAQYVLVRAVGGSSQLVAVQRYLHRPKVGNVTNYDDNSCNGSLDEASGAVDLLRLVFRCQPYVYNKARATFVPVPFIPAPLHRALPKLAANRVTINGFKLNFDRVHRQLLYGCNALVIPVKSLWTLLVEELVHPFYVFQYVSVIIWVTEGYVAYALVILLITMLSIIGSVVSAHRYRRRLAAMAAFNCPVEMLTLKGVKGVDSTELVPGDVIVVTSGVVPCDCILLAGECIVDENMLTGESSAVRKVPLTGLDGRDYHPDTHKQCTLYGGTNIAQVRESKHGGAYALVCRTAFNTAKGQLLKSILYPRRHKEHFATDAAKFIAFMLVVGSLFYVWAALAMASLGAPTGYIAMRCLDTITVAVPPALPACLAIATAIAVSRLLRKSIFVSNPHHINAAGEIDTICFDKTGTLTEAGLDLMGLVPVHGDNFQNMALPFAIPDAYKPLLATCHGLAKLGEGLVGDPLDEKLFAAAGYEMVELVSTTLGERHTQTLVHPPGMEACSYTIAKRFDFSSDKQRNTVVVRDEAGKYVVYCKGSPEIVRKLTGRGNVPYDFDGVLGEYTKEGYRVLALASRTLPHDVDDAAVEGLSQEAAERGLTFLGFAVMVNSLKPDTAGVITSLQTAGIRCCMVTGDHARTAVSVAHSCGMMDSSKATAIVDGAHEHTPKAEVFVCKVLQCDGSLDYISLVDLVRGVAEGELELAVTGRGWNKITCSSNEDLLHVVLEHGVVFARMSPDDKRELVDALGPGMIGCEWKGAGRTVGFCGDGANDVGALKSAAVGVSLCEAEASVAAPLTSRRDSIACMIHVVAEGRASCATSFAIFKFIITYAFIQLTTVNLLYSMGLEIGDFQMFIQDLFYTTVLASLMGMTRPATTLSRQRPPDTLLTASVMLPVAAQTILSFLFQTGSLWYLTTQSWYHKFDPRTQGGACFIYNHVAKECSASAEDSALFLTNLAQFIIMTVVFHEGKPFLKPLYTNTWLLLALMLQSAFLLYLVFSPGDWFTYNVGGIISVPLHYRYTQFGIMLLNLAASLLVDALLRVKWNTLLQRFWPSRRPRHKQHDLALHAPLNAAGV